MSMEFTLKDFSRFYTGGEPSGDPAVFKACGKPSGDPL